MAPKKIMNTTGAISANSTALTPCRGSVFPDPGNMLGRC